MIHFDAAAAAAGQRDLADATGVGGSEEAIFRSAVVEVAVGTIGRCGSNQNSVLIERTEVDGVESIGPDNAG